MHQILPSNSKFGFFFSFIFFVLSVYSYFNGNVLGAVVTLIFSVLLASVALLNARLLEPLNKLWSKLGLALGKISSPIVLGILFFLLISPVALITRLFGRDVLLMKKRTVSSYWKCRDQNDLPANSFKNQF